MDDEKVWIKQALAGNQKAFTKLVEAYQTPIYNLAYRMLGDPAEAEDAAQETFLRAYTRLHTFKLDKKFSSWILSIASHYCIDCLRKRRTSQVPLEDLLAQQVFSDPHEGPERRTLNRREREMVHMLMETLPEHYRAVLVLRYWHELSYKEMAEVLDTTQSAIKSRLHRARRLLAKHITELEAPSVSDASQSSSSATSNNTEKEALQNALSASY
jgi:RNA polymerase sigma-70 factor (ECF subfamily)